MASILAVLIIVDFMFLDDSAFIFEPDIKVRRGAARTSHACTWRAAAVPWGQGSFPRGTPAAFATQCRGPPCTLRAPTVAGCYAANMPCLRALALVRMSGAR